MVLEFINSDLMVFGASFLFVFAIVYALLAYSKIFKENKYASAIIALVFGFIAAAYGPFAYFIQNIMPYAAILLVVVFFIIFIKAIFGHGNKEKGKQDVVPSMIALAIMLILLAATWPTLASYLGITVSLSELLLWILLKRRFMIPGNREAVPQMKRCGT